MRPTVYSDYPLRLMIYPALKGDRLSRVVENAEAL